MAYVRQRRSLWGTSPTKQPLSVWRVHWRPNWQRVGTKRKREQNVFVLRAAAVSLGQIRSRAGTPALISALSNEKLDNDVRREAARSLGLIGDPSAVPALRAASTAADPFLSQLAYQALRKLGAS